MSIKPSNPKDAAAMFKVPLWLCSGIAKIKWAIAQAAGFLKYGAWNWRSAGVRASVYISAAERHLEKWKYGEELDAVDNSHHLANVMACCAIILEAQYTKKLVDDRPPSADLGPALAEAEATLARLREQYSALSPRHFTIADTEEINGTQG